MVRSAPSRRFTPVGGAEHQCYGPRASRPHGRPPPPARAAPVPWVLALLHHRTPRTRPGTAGLARQQRSRSCCERRTAPALYKMHALTRPSAAPPCASHGLGAPASAGLDAAASLQRAAPCAPHHSHKTSRDNTPHLCRRCKTQAWNGRRMAWEYDGGAPAAAWEYDLEYDLGREMPVSLLFRVRR